MKRRKTDLRALCVFAAFVFFAGAAAASAQPAAPDFSGTWRLDAARSKVTDAAGLAGLIPAGAPPTLHVTQPANGTLIIESQINEGHVRIYNPHAKSTTPAGQGGTVAMTSRWAGRTLVAEGAVETAAPGGATAVKQVKETFALSADGATLTIDVAATGPDAMASASTLVYSRTNSVGPCTSWPTPCKTPK